MSWLFSQVLVEAYLPASCSDGEPSAQLNVMPTPRPFWLKDKTIEFSSLSQFGPTSRRLTGSLGEALLTSFRAASPARTSARPAREPALTEPEADSGWKWRESFAKFSRDSSSWKTRQCSLLGGLEPYSETWPRWGSMLDGECSELTMPELPTNASASGLLPTPTASNTKAHHMRGADKGKPRESRSYGDRGPLNPPYLESLMGWPVKWTEFEPLETARFREWQQQHGEFSGATSNP